MKIAVFWVCLWLPVSVCQADIIDFRSAGVGASLDGKTSGTFSVPGFSSLTISIVNVTADGDGEVANATASSFGVNAAGGITTSGDNADRFDSVLNEAITFSFNKAVLVSYLDFSNFTNGEVFQFGDTVITSGSLRAGQASEYDFVTPLLIGANSPFTLQATSGSIGLQRIELDLAAVPEPSAVAMCCLGLMIVATRLRPRLKRKLAV